MQLRAAYGATDPERVARFWSELLGRPIVHAADGLLLPGEGSQLDLRFFSSDVAPAGLGPMHVHLTSESPAQQQETVTTALRLGGAHLDVGQREEEGHIVLADPERNPLCVIEPGNSFLAGCGYLGELACDGSREVGVFWSRALTWPLVWDSGDETAVQSPDGGTKVAWGGPPSAAAVVPARQRLELVVPHVGEAAERLVELGATRVSADTVLDPDGSEVRLSSR